MFDSSPTWSPNGKDIVYAQSTFNTADELFVVPAEGGRPRDLHIVGGDPAWGPSRIAYIGREEIGGPHLSLSTVKPDGTGSANSRPAT